MSAVSREETERLVTPSTSDMTVFGPDIVAKARQIIARYPESRSALLPMLHLVQAVEGYVTPAGVDFCAEQLHLTTAEVSAVVTFYTMYKRKPCGEHLVSVCTNTMCAMLGGDEIYKRLGEHLGEPRKPLGHEETAGTPGEPGSITLEHAECLAACDFGPVLQVNYEFYDNQTPESAVELVDALRRGEKPAPTRGAPLTDWRTVSMELAGFYPEDADEFQSAVDGPSAAAETLRGAQLAADRGWTAPAMPEDAPLPPVETR
ncbi:MAG TPA: NADH-quinone oxidoreductase subunit NuoE [Actinophytocola sp.]|uniref:NADH-quinone oxidoreductase subunit NuoE n=1 Tax=Actinophytocola sp. TaxID=1872138 RepID=UPI002DDD500B|nr:NADH-quinone oxidoreductase subunit NuoE [Actinophytocola sp.]HEV2779431.1 NADH-quinone oxidoreductase subunit NuoE [Actinophytocola sp.]